MIQQLLIGLIFLGAVLFLARLVWNSFQAKKRHQPGCAKCASAEKSPTSAQV